MEAICCESTMYDSFRVLRSHQPISYYEWRTIRNLVEIVLLHDRLVVLMGQEPNPEYHQSCINFSKQLRDTCGFEVIFDVEDALRDKTTIERFNEIVLQIYGSSMRIPCDSLQKRRPKLRLSGDDEEEIIRPFRGLIPSNVDIEHLQSVADAIKGGWLRSANNSEYLYFLRAHLVRTAAELRGASPYYANTKIFANILHSHILSAPDIATLPSQVNNYIDDHFRLSLSTRKFPLRSNVYAPVLFRAVCSNCTHRRDFLASLATLRAELTPFRDNYRDIHRALFLRDGSPSQQEAMRRQLEHSMTVFWKPIAASLATDGDTSALTAAWNEAKKCLNIKGDMKVSYGADGLSGGTNAVGGAAAIAGVYDILAAGAQAGRKIQFNISYLNVFKRVMEAAGLERQCSNLFRMREDTRRLIPLLEMFDAERKREWVWSK